MKENMTIRRAGLIILLGAVTSHAAPAQESESPKTTKQQSAEQGNSALATLAAGNGIYTIFMDDTSGSDCGVWTAATGPDHPAGPMLNVIFGGASGNPGTSDTTLRSYSSGLAYNTDGIGSECPEMCDEAISTVITPLMNDGTLVGWNIAYTLSDGANMILFEQHLEVVGPVDGTETVENTVIRETHTVTNMDGPEYRFGLRKHWDFEIGGDDGPLFGDCDTPTAACDVSSNFTADGSEDGLYPGSYIMNEDPATIDCGAGPFGSCDGSPIYIVGGTVVPPLGLNPEPTAPELLQFNSWPSLNGACWEPALVNNASCGGGDTAIAYFYGRTEATAEVLASGASRSFTQYVVAGEESCPGVVGGATKVACCLPGSACLDTSAADCTAAGGAPQNDGSSCATTVCSGACCYLGPGTCQRVTEARCLTSGGLYQGNGSSCNDPCTVLGACCVPNPGCMLTDGPSCVANGGVYAGNFTDCAEVDCKGNGKDDPNKGACCMSAGTCLDTTEKACGAMGGQFNELSCASVDCQGACCFPGTGTCNARTRSRCRAAGGVWRGSGTLCIAGCNQVGACCMGDACTITAGEDCAHTGSIWQGQGTACNVADCPDVAMACFCDLDGNGVVGFNDVLHLLAVWGPCGAPCQADVTVDENVGFADLITLLSEFGATCGP